MDIIKKIKELIQKHLGTSKELATGAVKDTPAIKEIDVKKDKVDLIDFVGGIEIFDEWIYGSLEDRGAPQDFEDVTLKEWRDGLGK